MWYISGSYSQTPCPVNICNNFELDLLNVTTCINTHTTELIHSNLYSSNLMNLIFGGGVSVAPNTICMHRVSGWYGIEHATRNLQHVIDVRTWDTSVLTFIYHMIWGFNHNSNNYNFRIHFYLFEYYSWWKCSQIPIQIIHDYLASSAAGAGSSSFGASRSWSIKLALEDEMPLSAGPVVGSGVTLERKTTSRPHMPRNSWIGSGGL